MIGRELSHFRITSVLGAGAMGTVYRAEDTRLGREVALKVLPQELAADPARLARFQQEARSVAALRHPHIVTIHSVEEDEGIHFITMELVEGRVLSSYVREGGVSLFEFFDIAVPLAGALASAHEKGVIHRDLKPGNVMVDDEAGVKILDFGLAKLRKPERDEIDLSQEPTEALTTQGAIVGTIPYMSPEQIEGKPIDHRSDLFSLGVVLYELATGVRPFPGDSVGSVISLILRDEPRPANDFNPRVPPQLAAVFARCMAKSPERRFQSADELRTELEAIRSGEASTTIVPSPRLPARRRRGLLAAVGAALLAVVALTWWIARPGGGRAAVGETQPIESVAVLPLANLSGDPAQEYFADGMTEALITNLSKIGALKVISRTSTARYKGSQMALPEIARELGVDAIVEGSVLRSGDRVRISAQLIHAASDENLWAESYERELEDVLRLQAEVARSIASGVKVSLTQQERNLLTPTRTLDPLALEAYLRGRHALRVLTRESIEEGIEYMQQALAVAPNDPLLLVGLADAYILYQDWGYMPRAEALPLVEPAVDAALAVDPNSASAWVALGELRKWQWDWSGAEEALERAIELEPGQAQAHYVLAALKSSLKRHDEAIRIARRAKELDPLSVRFGVDLGTILQHARRFDEAERELRGILEVRPNEIYAQWALATTLTFQGRYDEAIEIFLARNVATAGQNWMLGYTYGLSGRQEEGRAVLEFLLDRARHRHVPSAQIAVVYGGLGDLDKAFEWLERAYTHHEDWGLDLLQVQPYFDALRDDPRFDALVDRMGFPQ